MKNRRRLFDRHKVDAPARLCSLGGPEGARPTLSCAVQDVSLGGVRLIATKSIPVGSLWQIQFQNADAPTKDQALVVRSCRSNGSGGFVVGAQFVVDPATLQAAGVGAEAFSTDLRALAAQGARPQWETQSNIVARDAVSIESLCAVSMSAAKDLTVAKSIVDCTLDVNGRLNSPAASLIGGSAYVLRGARLAELGSPESHPTTIILGRSLGMSIMLAAADAELAVRKVVMDKRRAAIAELQSRQPTGLKHTDRERLTILMSEMLPLEQVYEKMDANCRKLRRRETGLQVLSLEVSKMIHPGVTMIAGDTQLLVAQPIAGPVAFGRLPDGTFDILPSPGAAPRSLTAFATLVRHAA